MGSQDGLWETLCDLSKSNKRAIQEYLETLSGYIVMVQWCSLNKEKCNFIQQDETKRYAWKPQGSALSMWF